MGRVVVLGSINMDCVVTVKKHPRLGETVLGKGLNYYPGGKGANQAVAAARLGAETIMLGSVGKDGFAKFLLDFLAKEGVNIANIISVEGATGTAFITVDHSGENTIVVASGANGAISVESSTPFSFKRKDILICQNEIPVQVMVEVCKKAKREGAKIIYNPAPAINVPKELLNMADILVVNETEYRFYKTFLKDFKQTLVQTLGAKGVKVISPSKEFSVKGHKVKALDTTGAGDCFMGALATQLSKGNGLEEAIQYANKAASIAVQRVGAGTGMPTDAEVS